MADALAYAHAQGIVHRDIKPSNLLLDTHGIAWVTDFGLAKADDQQNLTHTGDILGTLRYMPPEAFGGKVDSRGDIYSLGLTLYEMLAFRPAFDEKDHANAFIKQVITGEAPRGWSEAELCKSRADLVDDRPEGDRTARKPTHRYATAAALELADDLRRFVDDEPIRARRTSYAERLARWGRRNPALAALSGAVGLLALALIGGLWYGNESARRALKVQTALRGEADVQAGQARRAAGEARRAAAATEVANQALTSAQGSLRRTLYAAQLNLAQAAWDSGSPGRTLELLEATRPKAGEPDFRGFEWSYFRRQAHGERAIHKLLGFEHYGSSRAGKALSTDGALAAIVQMPQGRSNPTLLIIQETATGRLVRQTLLPALTPSVNSSVYTSLAFSADGTRLALAGALWHDSSGSRPGEAHAFVWSLADGRELFHDSWSEPMSRFLLDVALEARARPRRTRSCETQLRPVPGTDPVQRRPESGRCGRWPRADSPGFGIRGLPRCRH